MDDKIVEIESSTGAEAVEVEDNAIAFIDSLLKINFYEISILLLMELWHNLASTTIVAPDMEERKCNFDFTICFGTALILTMQISPVTILGPIWSVFRHNWSNIVHTFLSMCNLIVGVYTARCTTSTIFLGLSYLGNTLRNLNVCSIDCSNGRGAVTRYN